MTPRTLSIVIPCYDEATTIREVVERVQHVTLPSGWEREIIIVDDGSNKETISQLERLESASVKVVYRPINGGKGAAVKEGLAHVRGDYCIIQDADLELDPSDYAALLAPIDEGRAQVVFGYRILSKEHRGGAPLFFLSGKLLSVLYNVLFLSSFRDIPCCYKVFPKESIEELRRAPSDDFVFDAVELTRILHRRHKVVEVPVIYNRPRSHAQGKKLLLVHGVYCVLAILLLRVGLHHHPMKEELYKLGRYAVTGIVTVGLNLGVFYALVTYTSMWYLAASILSFVASFVVNFTLHKFWTFTDSTQTNTARQVQMHLALAVFNVFFNVAIVYVLVEYVGLWSVLAQALSALIVAAESFFLLSHVIFKR